MTADNDGVRTIWVVGGLLTAAACGGGHHATARLTPQQRAESACRAAAPHDFFNAEPTTVGEIHTISGPTRGSAHAYSKVLARLPANAFAAWCWRQPTAHYYVEYVVGPHGEVVNVNVTFTGEPPPNPGPEMPT